MNPVFSIRRAGAQDAPEVAALVGELLAEIMQAIKQPAFNFELAATIARLADFLQNEKYFLFVAHTHEDQAAGFIALSESFSLYAEGTFGTIPEFYVRPEHRSKQIGRDLMSYAKSFALEKGWKRLEVTTPPLPEFNRTMAFYEREGFTISGGRKLKLSL